MSQANVLEKVKKLRELTGVGFKDCKIAIDENNGDIEKSIEFLRKKGIAKSPIKHIRTIIFKELKTELVRPIILFGI